jgi:hypothetical protein
MKYSYNHFIVTLSVNSGNLHWQKSQRGKLTAMRVDTPAAQPELRELPVGPLVEVPYCARESLSGYSREQCAYTSALLQVHLHDHLADVANLL